ncbi:MAG: N-acetylmuramoyl-L-alanine amidase [Halocynthiibacter sp.]
MIPDIVSHPSPNFGPRKDGGTPRYIILHYTAMKTAQAALDRLCDPSVEVSAHYLISQNGTCFQLVEDEMRAWHAGAGRWGDITDMNSNSIGVEMDNLGHTPFSEPLMTRLETLLRQLIQKWNIPPQNVIGHSDMAPGRKIDPGLHFDWLRLAKQGLAIAPMGAPVAPQEFWTALSEIGYDIADADAALVAFRLRYRPWGAGDVCEADLAIASDIAAHFPVDRTSNEA